MDILGHVAYGATLCSRAGLAGGRGGSSAGSVWRDWTVWAAAGFALFPDVFSIGLAFAQMAMRGESVSFHRLPSFVFTLYRRLRPASLLPPRETVAGHVPCQDAHLP